MKRCVVFFVIKLLIAFTINAQNANGIIDMVEELAEKTTVSLTMPDGTELMADVYLPLLQDSFLIKIPVSDTDSMDFHVIPKGTQYIIYDSVNGQKTEQPYQLPVIFIRTPYNKSTETIGHVMAFLGYAVVIQDNRGAYSSQGAYLPMYSDSWAKTPYHPELKHALDITSLDDPRNANNHEDGYNSLLRIHELEREYNGSVFQVSNGNVGMIGFSALGNTQYQLASAHKVNPNGPGLKALMPIVATNEHYRFTAVQNGVFRELLVTGWIRSMFRNLLDDSLMESDTSLNNSIHTASDYTKGNKYEAGEAAIDHWISNTPDGELAGYYPNSYLRADLDASYAPLNASGEGSATGAFSRYTNMEVPVYHLTGWWDIFIDGQIETYNQLMGHLQKDSLKQLQKLVIGPWAHQTITETKTGDLTYPDNVREFLFDPLSMDTDIDKLPLERLFDSEMMHWFRYHLNYNGWKNTGLPKIIIPAAKEWTKVSDVMSFKVPSEDYVVPYSKFINYLAGNDSLAAVPYLLNFLGNQLNDSMDVPAMDDPVLNLPVKVDESNITGFKEIPNVRLYVVGPQNDGMNTGVGNYWLKTDSFPFIQGITRQTIYLHANGGITAGKSESDRASLSYIHDPDHPVLTAGGANMIARTPQTGRKNQGQMNLASEELIDLTMERPDVLKFETEELHDTLSVIGYPAAKLFAKSKPLENYTDSTNTDFMVRILDVYPGGEEYFVAEGAVNARARDYAKEIAINRENPSIPFTNIVSDEIYEYHFQMMPIAYTFGKGHKMKVLISSSNYPRYQSNPNLPLEPGEFFRREPDDGKTYNYFGKEMQSRSAEQTLYFTNDMASQLELPVYGKPFSSEPTKSHHPSSIAWNVKIYPNPADNCIYINVNSINNSYNIYNALGQNLDQADMGPASSLDISEYSPGIYFIKVVNLITGNHVTKKFVIK